MTADARVRPIFKWPGGKFKLLDSILEELPSGARLVEPFVGSCSVFLNSDYDAYLLCDVNADVIGFYRRLTAEGAGFIAACRELFAGGNAAEVYSARREQFNTLHPGGERAELFLYLNRHGYNGLIRYNGKGVYNVPFGRFAKPYFPEREMLAFLAKAGRTRVEFAAADFRATFARLEPGDVVYCDPPYYPLSGTANFTSYAGNTFGLAEQGELAELMRRAAADGIRVVASNHDLAAVRGLYAGAERLRSLRVQRSISCDKDNRGVVDEILAVF